MNNSHYSMRKHSTGFTLLELLVAMSLGIFLIAGLIQVLLDNRAIFNVQENSARMQEDGRFATTVLNNVVSLTGYREDPDLSMSSQFPSYTTVANPPAQTFLASEVVRGTDNDVGGGDNVKNGTDTIAIRYRSDGNIRDCLGIIVANGLISVNRFYVDDDDTLNCRSDVYNPTTAAAIRTSTQPLIDNVEDMQIKYGMSTGDVFHDVAAECYLDASVAIGTGGDCTSLNFSQVVSTRINILLHSGDDDLTPDKLPQTYTFDGANVLAGDNRLYRTLTATIAMRNKVL